jgi:hypothetical protein
MLVHALTDSDSSGRVTGNSDGWWGRLPPNCLESGFSVTSTVN